MELRDLVVTPLVLVFIYVAAYIVRPLVTDSVNKVYFFPALTAKIVGAIAVGFIYQFYYSGGDTFAYHTHGSRVLWEEFMKSPGDGVNYFFSHGQYGTGLWNAAEKIWFWRDPSSFFIVQIASFFDLITFSSYSATASLFAVLAFVGGWMLFLAFYKIHPNSHRFLAFSCLFVPTVIFWGSGILKDTVTFSFVGVATFCVYEIAIRRKISPVYFILLTVSFYVMFSIKKYILISFTGGIFVWIFSVLLFKVKSLVLRTILVPLVSILCFGLAFIAISRVVEKDSKYSIDQIAMTARITAYDIRYGWGARLGEGSGYTLGELDGTWQSMIKLAPAAINVSLFRPYLWEVRNPLMVLAALESLFTLLFTIFVFVRVGFKIFRYIKAEVVFCLVFALIFAFGVGASTFNFGTLSRYRIPLLPFYWSALMIIYSSWRSNARFSGN